MNAPDLPEPLAAPQRFAGRLEAEVVCTDVLLPLDRPSPAVVAVSLAARASGLWPAIAGLLALRPGVTRRAARHGVIAVAAATTAGHLLGHLVHRRRPDVADVPARRALPEHPSSSAFPSAHAASTAAFATAIALGAPALGALLTPPAALVAYSRLRTRVHWPTDVLGGALLGSGAALLTRRLCR
ncbi:phosphatase PAP2 family protein [Saccharothrix sp. HUAS TT1]|uniref:phosphatase PAP2 family protein n=1 Tax=unclassified Saccharothrix TaxID=2593673 RepID=UPI00345BAEE4